MSNQDAAPAPVLVLGVGNTLLSDDGVGVHLLRQLAGTWNDLCGLVEFVDGGTQGTALLGSLEGRTALILLDATALGGPPGCLHLRRDAEVLDLGSRSRSAHEVNAWELLATARLIGDLPKHMFLVGIEPSSLESGIRLSEEVQQAMPAALEAARQAIELGLGAIELDV